MCVCFKNILGQNAMDFSENWTEITKLLNRRLRRYFDFYRLNDSLEYASWYFLKAASPKQTKYTFSKVVCEAK